MYGEIYSTLVYRQVLLPLAPAENSSAGISNHHGTFAFRHISVVVDISDWPHGTRCGPITGRAADAQRETSPTHSAQHDRTEQSGAKLGPSNGNPKKLIDPRPKSNTLSSLFLHAQEVRRMNKTKRRETRPEARFVPSNLTAPTTCCTT